MDEVLLELKVGVLYVLPEGETVECFLYSPVFLEL